MTNDVHVLPIGDLVDHDETRTCWCAPRVEKLCGDCDGAGCWKCENGYTTECGEDDVATVIHNAADGRE